MYESLHDWATMNDSNSNFTSWMHPEAREHHGFNKCIESMTERGKYENEKGKDDRS